MKKAALIIMTVLLVAGQLLAQDGLRIMESLTMHSRILGQDVKYSVCLPVGYYQEKRSYPVVYLLHGLGDDETAWIEYGRISQYYDAEIQKDDIVPMIFIMPQGYRTYYVNDYAGTFNYQDMFINELVPYIDSVYRTIRDSRHRGFIGYSMGGFGALTLHLQHPDIFGAAVPLSISIRTDEQYETEYAPDWNEQWGRLFGGVGTEGPERITDYYKKNNPFYIIPSLSSSEYKKFRIYIDNGDDEQTLCRSNEELHILMRELGFPHEFRVRNGGHSFEYWCSALPNALHFLSDSFENKPYRGDSANGENKDIPTGNLIHYRFYNIDNKRVIAYIPEEFNQTDRAYPALYIPESLGAKIINQILTKEYMAVKNNEIAPMIVVSVPEKLFNRLDTVIPILEKAFRIRDGYRFRSVMGYREDAEQVCDIVMNRMQFSSCILIDAFLKKDEVISMLEMPEDALKKTPFFIVAPDNGNYFEGNGNLHMLFRDKELTHEYRVVEDIAGYDEIIHFVSENFHR
jgi:enterochelin esterase-like enzyme